MRLALASVIDGMLGKITFFLEDLAALTAKTFLLVVLFS